MHPSWVPLNCHHYYCSLPFDDSAFVVIVAVVDLAPSYRLHLTRLEYTAYYLMMSCRPYFPNYPIVRTTEQTNQKKKKKKMRQIIKREFFSWSNQYIMNSNKILAKSWFDLMGEPTEAFNIIMNSRHARARDSKHELSNNSTLVTAT